MFSVTYAECRYAESHNAEWRGAECHYAEWRCAQCRGAHLSPSLKLTSSHSRPLTNAALVPSIKITFLVQKMPS